MSALRTWPCSSCLKRNPKHRLKPGPDGPGTLCQYCFSKYFLMKLPVYVSKDGRISTLRFQSGTESRVTDFELTLRGTFDLLHPITEPVSQKPKEDCDKAEVEDHKSNAVNKTCRPRLVASKALVSPKVVATNNRYSALHLGEKVKRSVEALKETIDRDHKGSIASSSTPVGPSIGMRNNSGMRLLKFKVWTPGIMQAKK